VDGEVAGGETGGGCSEARCGGWNTGQDIMSGAVGGSAGAIFDCDCGVGEGCAGGVEDGAFDAKAVGAALRVGGAQRRCEQDQSGRSPDPDCDSVLHGDLILGDKSDNLQCRLSGIAYDKRHVGDRGLASTPSAGLATLSTLPQLESHAFFE